MISSVLIQEFLEESHLQAWVPLRKPEQAVTPMSISSLKDLLHLPRASTLCLFSADFPEEFEEVKTLFLNILSCLKIQDYLILFGTKACLDEWMERLVSRTGATKILSFGVDLRKEFSSCEFTITKSLQEVLKDPLLKSQVWKDVSQLRF